MKQLFIFLIIAFFGLSFDRLNVFKYCILSSILHECGHIAAYMLFTKNIPEIRVSIFGFVMSNNVILAKHIKKIIFAGPFVNIFFAVISLILIQYRFSLNNYVFMVVNSVIAVFNLLPVYYLDGGQLLYQISAVYQRFYIEISILSVVCISVMVIYFTHIFVPVILFDAYFILNIVNDI